MIAIFTSSPEEFYRAKKYGQKEFVIVRDTNSIRGITFTSCLIFYVAYRDREIIKAIKELEQRQPELFQKPFKL